MPFLKEKIAIGIEEAELKTQTEVTSWPLKTKRLLLVLVIATIPGFFIAKYSTRAYVLYKNKDKVITSKPSFTDPKPPEISDITVVTPLKGVYMAVAKISNQNIDLSLTDTSYKFTFYNNQKQQVYEQPGKLYLLANQAKYIIVPKFSSTEEIAYADFKLQEKLPWQKRINTPGIKIARSVPKTFQQSEPPGFVAEGDVVNNSAYTLKEVNIAFIAFDSTNKIVGLSKRAEFSLKPFERRGYKQIWPELTASQVSRVEVSADTNALDPQNLSAPELLLPVDKNLEESSSLR